MAATTNVARLSPKLISEAKIKIVTPMNNEQVSANILSIIFFSKGLASVFFNQLETELLRL